MLYGRCLSSSLQAASTRAPSGSRCQSMRHIIRTRTTGGGNQPNTAVVGTTVTSKRFESSSSSSSSSSLDNQSNATTTIKNQQDGLKWTERDEAPKWMQKMAPSKGGTNLPNPLEGAVIAVVAIAGYYAWFVEPPTQASSSSSPPAESSAATDDDETTSNKNSTGVIPEK
jgi:hypothetical protein